MFITIVHFNFTGVLSEREKACVYDCVLVTQYWPSSSFLPSCVSEDVYVSQICGRKEKKRDYALSKGEEVEYLLLFPCTNPSSNPRSNTPWGSVGVGDIISIFFKLCLTNVPLHRIWLLIQLVILVGVKLKSWLLQNTARCFGREESSMLSSQTRS